MAKFPEPPSNDYLRTVAPAWYDLPADTLLMRAYNRGGAYPTTWDAFRFYGPLSLRFDHHVPPPSVQRRGVLYGATLGTTCLAEKFQAGRTIDPFTNDPWLAGFRVTRPIRLLDLTGAWPTRAGASMAINSGPRPRARRWSRAIYEAYPDAEGLWYGSSMYGNRPSVALYERAISAMPSSPELDRALADGALRPALEAAVAELNYLLILRPYT